MRLFTVLALAVVMAVSQRAHAANLFGSLWLDGRPVQGAQIEVTCSDRHQAQTDNNGSYSIFIPEKGRCVFQVVFAGHSGRTEVASYDNPIKYDFDLIRQNDGNYVLRSK